MTENTIIKTQCKICQKQEKTVDLVFIINENTKKKEKICKKCERYIFSKVNIFDNS